jgi:hypothetical protein
MQLSKEMKKNRILERKARIQELQSEIDTCKECMREAIEEQESKEYINYFDNHIKEGKKEIRQLKDEIIGQNPIKHNVFVVSVLAFIGVMFMFFISALSPYNAITGFSVLDAQTVDVYKLFTENKSMNYVLDNSANSFSLSGSFIGAGRAKVYVVNDGSKTLIFDTSYISDKGKLVVEEVVSREPGTTFTFDNVCLECNVDGMIENEVNIDVEAEGATLYITKINYGVSDLKSNVVQETVLQSKSEEAKQVFAEINKPVKWVKIIKRDKKESVEFELPSSAVNVQISEVVGDRTIGVEDDKITELKPIGFSTQAAEEKIFVIEDVEDLEIEYETSAPMASEVVVSNSEKHVLVSSDLHYENVLTYTTIEESFADNILVYWVENNDESKKRVFTDVEKQDTNNNGLVDRLEWITPHLSTQKFIVTTNYSNATGNLVADAVNDVFVDDTYYYIATDAGLDLKYVANGSAHGNISSPFRSVFALNNRIFVGNTTGLFVVNSSLIVNESYTVNISVVNDIDCQTVSGFDYCAIGTDAGLRVLNVSSGIVRNSTQMENIITVKFEDEQIVYSNYSYLFRTNDLEQIFYHNEYEPEDNITGWWHLEDGNDSSGRGLDLTLQGIASYTSTGFIGSALSLPGNILDEANVTLASGFDGGKEFTVSLWVKSDLNLDDNTYKFFIAKSGVAGKRSWHMSHRDLAAGNDRIRMSVFDTNSIQVAHEQVYTGDALTDGSWHHVAVTIDFNVGNVTIYKDGVLEGTDTTLNTSSFLFDGNSTEPVVIGGASGSSGLSWNGTIDEVAIYDRAFTAQEISDYYNKFGKKNELNLNKTSVVEIGNGTIFAGTDKGVALINSSRFDIGSQYPNITDSKEVRLWLHMDDGNDSSGNDFDGALSGTASFTPSRGRIGGGLEVTGATTSNFGASDVLISNSSKAYTVALWTRPNISNNYGYFEMRRVSGGGGFAMIATASNNRFYCQNQNGSGQFQTIQSPIDHPVDGNTWYHVACVFNGTYMILYVDGIEMGKSASSGQFYNENYADWRAGVTVSREMNGTLDEILVVNNTLSPQEIWQLYIGSMYSSDGFDKQLAGSTNNVTSLSLTKDEKTLYVGTSDGIETGGAVSEVNVTSDLQIYNWSSGYGEGLVNYTISAVARFGNTSYNELTTAVIDTFRLLVGTSSGASLIAAQYLSNNVVNESLSGNFVNATSPINFGQNLTIDVNVSSTAADIDNVWVAIWEAGNGSSNHVIDNTSYLTLSNEIYSIPVVINGSFEARQYNYSVYVNDTAGNVLILGGLNFTVNGSMQLTLNLSANTTSHNFTLSGHVNLSDGTTVTDTNISIYYNGTLLYFNKTLGILVNYSTSNATVTDSLGNFNYTFVVATVDGTHTVIVNATSRLVTSSVSMTVDVDTTAPAMAINQSYTYLSPTNNRVDFNFTVTDSYADNISCDITINDVTNASALQVTNNTLFNYTLYNLSDSNYSWNITCSDDVANSNTSSTTLLVVDSTEPELNITFPVNGSSLASSTLNRTLNWTVSDSNLEACFYSLNDAANLSVTCATNYANFTAVTKVQNNITLYANDSVGNIVSQNIVFTMNSAPTIPELTEPQNATEKIFVNLTFTWNASTDSDGDSITYEIYLGNDTNFSLVVHNATTTSLNYSNTSIYSDGVQYWKIRAYDGSEYSNFTDWRQIDIVAAVINITSPANNSIIYPAATYSITVDELNRTEWATNVTIQVQGDGVEAVQQANVSTDNLTWSVSYTVPVDLSPTTVTVIVRAYNYSNGSGSATEVINDTIQLRVTRTLGDSVSAPVVTRLVPDPTNQEPNMTVNLSVVVDLDTLLETVVMNLTKPDGDFELLIANETLDNTTSFVYRRNYTIIPDQLGIYTVIVTVTDVNSQSSNKSVRLNVANIVNHTLNKTNALNIKLIDTNTGDTLVANVSNQSTIIPGQYDVEITTEKPTVDFFNSTINSTVKYVLNYSDLSENIVPPSSRRSAETFEIASDLQFVSVNVTFNYSSINSSIVEASNLEMYKCVSTTDCTWLQLTVSVDEAQGLITGTSNNLSVFMVAEPTATTSSSSSSSQGSGGGTSYVLRDTETVRVERTNLNIISPAIVTLNRHDELSVPVIIRNSGAVDFENVDIDISTLDSEIFALSDKILIPRIAKNSQEKVNVKIITKEKMGSYSVFLRAFARSHLIADDGVIQVNVQEEGSSNKTDALAMLEFAEDLFNRNVECLELSEILVKGREMIEQEQFGKAKTLLDSGINACKQLVGLISAREARPAEIFKRFRIPSINQLLEKLSVLKYLTTIDLVLLGVAGFIVIVLIVYHYVPIDGQRKKRKGSR